MKNAPPAKVPHGAWIWAIWKERLPLIGLLCFLTLLSSAVAVSYPYLAKLLFDSIQAALESGDASAGGAVVDRFALLFLAVGAAQIVAGFFPAIRGATNSFLEHIIRMKYFRSVLDKDSRFFATFRSGDVVTRLTDDIYDFPKLAWFLCSGIFRAVESASKIGFCMAAMFLLNPKLTLYSLIPVPLMVAVFWVTQDRIYDAFQRNQEAISSINDRLEMSFSGVRIIKAYAAEGKYRRFFEADLARRKSTEMAAVKLETVLTLIDQYVDYFAQIGVIFAGGLMAIRGEITVGTFYAFYNYLSMLLFPMLDIPQLFLSGKRAFVNIDRLEQLREFPIASAASDGALAPGDFSSIEFKNVSFRYEGRKENALDNVSFRVSKGERLCLIGPVGSGKSTVVKLLCALHAPDSGAIEVDGIDLSRINADRFRGMTGYVPQEPLLFTGTIRENVAFGSLAPDCAVTDEAFADAIDTARMGPEMASFADGELTLLGQRGSSVSGGQKQRLAVARALVRAPKLLLLDDITASLDASNEEHLMSRLDEASVDTACIVVSHRLSTLRYVDKVLFLDGGRVAAYGTHEENLAVPAYAEFMAHHLSR
ncbi:MAG: ABC transporter ATP-binding protein [Spirochaetes bacterium]|nr:ABC transporter ATP-binding protein [Spirochaetota bacterium]